MDANYWNTQKCIVHRAGETDKYLCWTHIENGRDLCPHLKVIGFGNVYCRHPERLQLSAKLTR